MRQHGRPATAAAERAPAGTGLAGTGTADTGAAGSASASTAPAGSAGQAAAFRRGGGDRPDPVPWLIALAVLAAYIPISVFPYLRDGPQSWDLGIFTEYVKQYAHLRAPVTDIRGAGVNLLGDHFHPLVAVLAPVFRLFPTPVTLLVAQAVLAAVSVVPVSRAAAATLGTGAGRAIGAAYGLSWGLQQLVNFDFHEVAFAVPLLACSLSALARGRVRAAALWALPLVLVKEDQGFTVAAIGLIITLAYRRRAAGLLLAGWGITWSVLAIWVIIPHFNARHVYPYWTAGGGISPAGGHLTLAGLLSQLVAGAPVKLPTVALILLPTAFLALRSPLVLAAAPGILLRFVSTSSSYWETTWHYNATVMPIVFIAAIDAMARIRAARATGKPGGAAGAVERHGPAVMLAICAALAFQFPLAALWQPQTYAISKHVAAARAAMARVPGGAAVQTDLDLLAPLGARTDTFWLGNSGNPATPYVVFDTASTDWQPPPARVLPFVERLNHGVRYRQIYADDGVYVFRRSGGA